MVVTSSPHPSSPPTFLSLVSRIRTRSFRASRPSLLCTCMPFRCFSCARIPARYGVCLFFCSLCRRIRKFAILGAPEADDQPPPEVNAVEAPRHSWVNETPHLFSAFSPRRPPTFQTALRGRRVHARFSGFSCLRQFKYS